MRSAEVPSWVLHHREVRRPSLASEATGSTAPRAGGGRGALLRNRGWARTRQARPSWGGPAVWGRTRQARPSRVDWRGGADATERVPPVWTGAGARTRQARPSRVASSWSRTRQARPSRVDWRGGADATSASLPCGVVVVADATSASLPCGVVVVANLLAHLAMAVNFHC